MYKDLKSPVAVQLELTTKCNHRCVHCYNHWREESVHDETLTEGQIRKIINNMVESEIPSFLVTGGEPMLYPDLMFKALEMAQEAGIKCSLNSNLTLVTPEIAEKLGSMGIGVLTSLLSYDRETHDRITCSEGSFDKLIKGIKLLQRSGVSVAANMVVMQANLDHIYDTGKFVHELGLIGFRATKVHPSQGSPAFENHKLPSEDIHKIFDALIELNNDFGLNVDSLTTYPICLLKNMDRYGRFLLKRGCSAGKTGCTVGADGQLRPCGHSDMSYGDTTEESFLSIWPKLREWRDGSLLPDECKKCRYVVRCSGGCRMDCKYYGKIDSMDPYATRNKFDYIPLQTEPVRLLPPKSRLSINTALTTRKEAFGVALIIDGDLLSVVTDDSANLLRSLTDSTFTPESIAKEYNLDLDTVRAFFTGLHRQQVVSFDQSD